MALAPALRKLAKLEMLSFKNNKIGNQSISSLVDPPLQVVLGVLVLPTGDLSNLKWLYLSSNEITDAGCRTLVTAIESNEMPALVALSMKDLFASDAMRLVEEALQMSIASRPLVMVFDPRQLLERLHRQLHRQLLERRLAVGVCAWLCLGAALCWWIYLSHRKS